MPCEFSPRHVPLSGSCACPKDAYFDDETCRLEPIENPFGPKLLPMSPEICYLCAQNGPLGNGAPGRTRTCDPRLRRSVALLRRVGFSATCGATHASYPRDWSAVV